MFELTTLILITALGLGAGVLGGMLGVGGSILMIPGLVWLLGRPTGDEQHLYQAAAMLVNVVVAVPAAARHRKAGAMQPEVLKWMMPAAVVMVLVGVGLSNLPVFRGQGSIWLGRILALFLLVMAWRNAVRWWSEFQNWRAERLVAKGDTELQASDSRANRSNQATGQTAKDKGDCKFALAGKQGNRRSLGLGALMGLIAGLLGVGGGAIVVPMQQIWLKLPLKSCIANSSAVMMVSAGIGSIAKNATLPAGQSVLSSLTIAGLLAPTAFIGAKVGAGLTHRLPQVWVRGIFVLLMLAAAWRLVGA